MNKVILSVFILASVLYLTDAACDQTAVAKCQTDAQAAAAAAGNDKSKICPIISTWENCLKTAGCPITQAIKDLITAMEQAVGVTCGSSVAKISTVAMLFALVASYMWK